MEGDHQVVHVTVTPHGYDPSTIQLKAGVPTRIVFKQTSDSECLSQVKIPDFGVEATNLPLNKETAIEFTPNASGNFTFTCGMEMTRGTIVVAS
jgi:plastocyanin domain-containing protein